MYRANPFGFSSPQVKTQADKGGNTHPFYSWFEDFDSMSAVGVSPYFEPISFTTGTGESVSLPNGVLSATSDVNTVTNMRCASTPLPAPVAGRTVEFEARFRWRPELTFFSKENTGTGIPHTLWFGLHHRTNLAAAPNTNVLANNGNVQADTAAIGFSVRPGNELWGYAHYRSSGATPTRRKLLGSLPQVDQTKVPGSTALLWCDLGVVIDGNPAYRGEYPTVEFFLNGKSLYKGLMPYIPSVSASANNKAYLTLQTTFSPSDAADSTVLVDWVRFASTREFDLDGLDAAVPPFNYRPYDPDHSLPSPIGASADSPL
jgi:hypothetical protein